MQISTIEAMSDDPAIAALDMSVFGRADLLNMILQRSEVLYDSPSGVRAVRGWMAGDHHDIEAEVDRLGVTVARRTAAVILGEYRAMRDTLLALGPRRVADIGCGYALLDLFLYRDCAPDLVLIDIEANEGRHFGFAEEGAAYTSLAVARAFLTANGVPDDRIATVNPTRDDLGALPAVDLAMSIASCGFHYPVGTYMDFFRGSVTPGGTVLLDLRRSTFAAQAPALEALGQLREIPGHPKARRVVLCKVPA